MWVLMFLNVSGTEQLLNASFSSSLISHHGYNPEIFRGVCFFEEHFFLVFIFSEVNLLMLGR